MNERELLGLLVPWVRERTVEFGERKWKPEEATLTVIEGPHLELEELSMGRGWQNAQHNGRNVTEQALAQARAASQQAPAPPSPAPPRPTAVQGAPDELLALLGDNPQELLQAWRLAAGRRPELSPGQALALAEETLRSLGGR